MEVPVAVAVVKYPQRPSVVLGSSYHFISSRLAANQRRENEAGPAERLLCPPVDSVVACDAMHFIVSCPVWEDANSKKSGSQLLVRVFVYVPHLKSPGPLLPATNSSSFLSGIVASTMSLLPSTAGWFLHFMPSANCRRLPWPHPRLTLSSDEHHATHLSRSSNFSLFSLSGLIFMAALPRLAHAPTPWPPNTDIFESSIHKSYPTTDHGVTLGPSEIHHLQLLLLPSGGSILPVPFFSSTDAQTGAIFLSLSPGPMLLGAIDARIHFDTRARSRVVQSADILGTYNTVALLMTRTKATTVQAFRPERRNETDSGPTLPSPIGIKTRASTAFWTRLSNISGGSRTLPAQLRCTFIAYTEAIPIVIIVLGCGLISVDASQATLGSSRTRGADDTGRLCLDEISPSRTTSLPANIRVIRVLMEFPRSAISSHIVAGPRAQMIQSKTILSIYLRNDFDRLTACVGHLGLRYVSVRHLTKAEPSGQAFQARERSDNLRRYGIDHLLRSPVDGLVMVSLPCIHDIIFSALWWFFPAFRVQQIDLDGVWLQADHTTTRYSGYAPSSRSFQCGDFEPNNTIQYEIVSKLPIEMAAPAGKDNRRVNEICIDSVTAYAFTLMRRKPQGYSNRMPKIDIKKRRPDYQRIMCWVVRLSVAIDLTPARGCSNCSAVTTKRHMSDAEGLVSSHFRRQQCCSLVSCGAEALTECSVPIASSQIQHDTYPESSAGRIRRGRNGAGKLSDLPGFLNRYSWMASARKSRPGLGISPTVQQSKFQTPCWLTGGSVPAQQTSRTMAFGSIR
ncbi:uncharacterized protein CLUP02_01944 [Colletotrichum lupini]|uniref:Uncharacterized protein n=1 Tax=Colletotrichum lupini TaxID=145971 RepID=A0A9Q8WAD9_9PEZI|nr:uncharacterized protein CLUP02_01944 [Colletotrichum lupini]UQC75290.1 hypothetical protein CLUP02_01944 [Colletotrichum lupini]